MSESGFKSILHDDAGTSGAEMVRNTTFFSGTVAEERWAHKTMGESQCPVTTFKSLTRLLLGYFVSTYPLEFALRTSLVRIESWKGYEESQLDLDHSF